MNGLAHDPRQAKVSELADRYAREGYQVFVQPEPHLFPFDLGGFRPDLLARKADEHLMILVKTVRTQAPVDRFIELVEEVRRHPGWRFLLVNIEDDPRLLPGLGGTTPSWEELRERTGRAERLLKLKEPEAAFLLLWATLESILRRQAGAVGLPIERFEPRLLIKNMFQQGVISIEQYDAAEALLEVRNRVAHGFEATGVVEATQALLRLVRELLGEWASGRQAA